MTDYIAADTATAVDRIREHLPSLVGDQEWSHISDDIQQRIESLRVSKEPMEAVELALYIQILLAKYDSASTRLSEETLVSHAVRRSLEADISREFADLNLSDDLIRASIVFVIRHSRLNASLIGGQQSDTRNISLPTGGVGGATSCKIRNIWVNSGKLVELSAEAMLAGGGIATTPHPILVVAGLLFLIRRVNNVMTINISEIDASVLWGLIQASGQNYTAEAREILKRTNEERQRHGMGQLSADQVQQALKRLEEMRCITRATNTSSVWKLIERFEIVVGSASGVD